MPQKLLQFSAVVVGDAHNPTILNPDFLAHEGIVPKSWNWQVAETFTTPAMSIVSYANGVTITVEPTKLQVADSDVESGLDKSRASEIAAAYIGVLKHVRYSAIGNNFHCLIPLESPKSFVQEKFLKDGPWIETLEAVGIRLVFPIDLGRLTIAIDSGEAKRIDESDTHAVVIANANFSRHFDDPFDVEQVAALLRKSRDDWRHFQELADSIFSV